MKALADMCATGTSYNDMAARLSDMTGSEITKNMVAGRLRLMREAGKAKPHEGTKPGRPKGSGKPAPDVFTPRNIGIMQLRHDSCRFITNEDDGLYCGHKTVTGKSWCKHHYAIVFQKQGG